jgi:uncharacterized protein (DUF1330 family)
MPHYLIAQVKITDDSWIPEYAAKVPDIIHRHGGSYLSRSANITRVEGDQSDLDLVAIVEFPDMESLRAFVSDPDYEPFRAARQNGAHSQLFAIDSTDVAGAIDYLAPAR